MRDASRRFLKIQSAINWAEDFGEYLPGSPGSCRDLMESSLAAFWSIPPGEEAISKSRHSGWTKFKSSEESTGAGTVFTIKRKPGSLPRRSSKGIASKPEENASARAVGFLAQIQTDI